MGVYIKGMKMPKDCNACFLDLYDRQTYCHNGEKALCPLIEVKAPHGKLIDIDAVVDDYSDGLYTEIPNDHIDKISVVIEAEVE